MNALCVDDHEENLIFLESVLKGLGFEAISAHHGAEALEILQSRPIALVVSDLRMPVMDGFTLCREMRLHPEFAKIPFVVHNAGDCDARDADLARRLGATAFILSPLDPLTVREQLQKIWTLHVECPVPAPASIPSEEEFLRAHNALLAEKLAAKAQECEQLREKLEDAFARQVQELSQRRSTESHLAESEERETSSRRRIEALGEIIDHSHDAIVVCRQDGGICYWNKGAELLYGWKTEEAIDAAPEDLFARPQKGLESPFQKALERGNFEGEFRHLTKEHREIFTLGRFSAIQDDNGDTCVLAYYFDITEKKQLEERFMRAQRMESIGILAGGVAHDLNNMLVPILLGIPVLRSRITDRQGLSMLDTMEASATRGSQIVKQILNFSRGLKSDRTNIQVRHLLREVAEIINETFPRNISIHADIPRHLWLLNADPTRLHQVFMNLCVNARDAMPEGGRLSLTAENQELNAAQARRLGPESRPGRFVCITVSDTGLGISEEHKAKIWLPFFTTKDEGKGTGLGLSTVRSIVAQHEGFISLESTVGKGSSFSLFLPASESQQEEVRKVQAQIIRGEGQRILVVDDEYALRQSCEELLCAHGYRTLSASSGLAALELLRQNPEDVALVISDLLMPGMSGAELISMVKSLRPEIASIAISGTLLTDRETHGPAGVLANAFLSKPFNAEQLLHAVHEVLQERKR